MKKKSKVLLAAICCFCIVALFTAACNENGKDTVQTFEVAAEVEAKYQTSFAVPSASATMSSGAVVAAEAQVFDSQNQNVSLSNGRFMVNDLNGYKIVYSVVVGGETLAQKETKVKVVNDSAPTLTVMLPQNKVVKTGTDYVIDESKISAAVPGDSPVTLGYSVTYGTETVDFDKENKSFTVDKEGKYDITISATANEKTVSEVYSVYGVNRSDEIFADFEYETDINFFENGSEGYESNFAISDEQAHSGEKSLKVTSTSNKYPQVYFVSDSNLNIRTGSVLSMWLRVEAPEDYEYRGYVGVNFEYAQYVFPCSDIGGYNGSSVIGEWRKFSVTIPEGISTLANFHLTMFIRDDTGIPVDGRVSLYIDDIRLEPHLQGDLTYFVEGDSFDLDEMETGFYDGNGNLLDSSELEVRNVADDSLVTPDENGIVTFSGTGNIEYRVSHPSIEGEYVSLVRRDVTPVDGTIYYGLTGAYDVALFETSVPMAYGEDLNANPAIRNMTKSWNQGTEVTVKFAEDLGIKITEPATVRFKTLTQNISETPYTVTLIGPDGEESVIYTGATSAQMVYHDISFGIPQGGSLTDYSFRVNMGDMLYWTMSDFEIVIGGEVSMEGKQTYFVQDEEFDLKTMETEFVNVSGIAYEWSALTVKDSEGNPVTVTDGKISLASGATGDAVYTVGHPRCEQVVWIVKKDLTPDADGRIYYGLSGEYDMALFDTSVAFEYAEGTENDEQYRQMNKPAGGVAEFTIKFAEDLGIDFSKGATVSFGSVYQASWMAYSVTVMKGDETIKTFDNPAGGEWKVVELAFDIPAGGSITDYTLKITTSPEMQMYTMKDVVIKLNQ